MRSRNFVPSICSPLRLISRWPPTMLSANPVWPRARSSATATPSSLATPRYRLDGIDAPELDQICIDDHADPWACGVEAREQLTKLVGGKAVHCDDLGPDKTHRKSHLGVCTAEGEPPQPEPVDGPPGLRDRRQPSRQKPFRRDETGRQRRSQGPLERLFRRAARIPAGKKDGAAARRRLPRRTRIAKSAAVLFPEDLAMPPRCSIKGKFAVRARFTGNVGIYHLQGCRSYPALTKPDRWFCSEDDAQAGGP